MAFEELKQRQAAMWGAGPFEVIALNLVEMHAAIVGAADAGDGDEWLDVGCGTGELAFLAAATGASVRGCDLPRAHRDGAATGRGARPGDPVRGR